MSNPYESPLSPTEATNAIPRGIYYGWAIVPCAAVAMAATLPARTQGLGMITKRLLEDFPQISESRFAAINLAATLVGGLACLPCGWLIDRFGTRTIVTFSIGLLGAAVLWLSQVRDEPSLVAALTLTRALGQSMLSVVSITMVAKWFQRRIGPAMGLFSVLMTFLMAAGFGIVGERVIATGWREAWYEVGITLLIIAPLVGLFTWSVPSNRLVEFAPVSGKLAASSGASLFDALRTPCFWMFAGSISYFGLVSSGLSLFQQLVLEERGFEERLFHIVIIIGLLVGMVTNLAAGGLARVVPLQWLLSAGLLLMAISLGMLPLITEVWQAYVYAVMQGISGGLITVMFFAVWGHAFGDRELGRIQSAAQMLSVFASAIGPIIVATSHEFTKSYGPIIMAFAAISAVMGMMAAITRVPSARDGAWATESNHG